MGGRNKKIIGHFEKRVCMLVGRLVAPRFHRPGTPGSYCYLKVPVNNLKKKHQLELDLSQWAEDPMYIDGF